MDQPQPQPGAIDRLLVISDPHVGSTVGLMPRGFRTAGGNEIGLNAVQEFLLQSFERMVEWATHLLAGSNYGLILNGDMIDGDHHGTKQIWSKDLGDQIDAAVEVFRPLTYRASKVFMIRGTESHTGNVELAIGRALRAERNPATGLHVFDRLHITVNGCRCAFRHHVGTSTRSWTEATSPVSSFSEEILQAVRNGEQPRRVLGVAHRHKFGAWRNNFGVVVVSPPWQMPTRFCGKVVPEARTQPGAYILDWRGLPPDSLPAVHEKLFAAPPEPEIIA